MSEQVRAEQDGADDTPAYRVSHLQDDLADVFAERDAVQEIAPLHKGGVKPRVHNRVTFTVSDMDRARWVEQVLDDEGFAWTTGNETGEYVVLGRAIRDLRELRKGDRIHLNKRGGPFEVYRVMEQETGPEVLQRSAPSVTVELSNADTETDWMVVRWKNDSEPWAYCRTKDKHASRGFRYRKVESVERSGRIGPFRLFAPSHDHISEGYHDTIQKRVEFAKNNGWLGDAHPSDVGRVLNLMTKPAAELFSPEDADTVREVLNITADAYERQGNAMAMEAGADEDPEEMKALAADNQDWGNTLRSYAKAFNLIHMDAVDDSEETDVYHHIPCGKAFTDRFKYSKHCGLCDADNGEESEQAESEGDK